jgi:hypothetical protein
MLQKAPAAALATAEAIAKGPVTGSLNLSCDEARAPPTKAPHAQPGIGVPRLTAAQLTTTPVFAPMAVLTASLLVSSPSALACDVCLP